MRCSICGMEGQPSERFCRNCGKVFEEGEYYIWKKGTTQPLGPITESDLKSKLAASQLTKDDSIAKVGEQNWTPLWQTPFARETSPLVAPNYQNQPRNPNFGNQQPYANYGNQPNYGNQQVGFPNQQIGFPNQQALMQPSYGNCGVPAAYQRGDFSLGSRLGGILIDGLIAIPLTIMAIIPFIGIIGAPLLCLYWISRDSIMGNGQSIGKRAAGVRVVKSDGQPFMWADSVRRNLIYFAVLLLMLPYFGIFLYAFTISILGLVEFILILSGGQRIGDRMGDTYVVKV